MGLDIFDPDIQDSAYYTIITKNNPSVPFCALLVKFTVIPYSKFSFTIYEEKLYLEVLRSSWQISRKLKKMIQRKKTNIVAVLFRSKLEFKKRYSSFFVIFPVLVLVSMPSSLENVSVWVGADWLVLFIVKNKKRKHFLHTQTKAFLSLTRFIPCRHCSAKRRRVSILLSSTSSFFSTHVTFRLSNCFFSHICSISQ